MMPSDPRRAVRGPQPGPVVPGSQQQSPGMPGPGGKTGKETNWTAVGAVAAVAGVVVAFVTYAVPRIGAQPYPPARGNSRQASVYSTTPAQHQGSTSAVTSPGFASSGPAVAQPGGPPAGCEQAMAAISTYNQDVGSTSASEANAAQRAVSEIEAAQEAADYSGTVGADLYAVNNDFRRLYVDATDGNSSDYDTTAAQTNVDAQQLSRDCNSQ